jgi:ubiquinone/menaquinone biosynthesis C-methylase UbiE
MFIGDQIMIIFDTIGETYDNTRQADGRIVARMAALLTLPAGSQIADIGAGTGNYSRALAEAGFRVQAVEPSSVMQRQARFNTDVQWLQGSAEQLPLADASVDGVVSTLAVCHFLDIGKALAEMARICRTGSAVIFTFDCDAGRRTWLYEYFPFLWDLFDAMPSASHFTKMLGRAMGCRAAMEPFPLPTDLTDGFAAAAWQRPWQYLDGGYRANISSFAKAAPNAVTQGVQRLADDLAAGVWEQRHGSVMQLPAFDAGYRFVFTNLTSGL